ASTMAASAAHHRPQVRAARLAATDPAPGTVVTPTLPPALAGRIDDLVLTPSTRDAVSLRAADLVAYQHEAYAERYLRLVERVAAADEGVDGALTAAVGRSMHQLMAYKDEYEVARLATGPEARRAVAEVAGPEGRGVVLLHPPLLRRLGLQRKLRFGPAARPVLRGLAKARRLRGTALDPFGRDPLRRTERALIAEYEAMVDELLAGLHPGRVDEAVAIAGLPDRIRGYEDLKMRRVAEYRSAAATAMAHWRRPPDHGPTDH
ncbi:MAG: DUF6537 domain-containing protein, partial [Actinomycetota bacterium]